MKSGTIAAVLAAVAGLALLWGAVYLSQSYDFGNLGRDADTLATCVGAWADPDSAYATSQDTEDDFGTDSYVRQTVAESCLRVGMNDTAALAVKGITNPDVLIWLYSDKRYDAIMDRGGRVRAVMEAGGKAIAGLREKAAAAPDDLDKLATLLYGLTRLGRPGEALALADRTLAYPPKGKSRKDLLWIMNARADALFGLGRYDEAADQMARASLIPEKKGINVSQKINLAFYYDALGRPKDALAAAASLTLKDVSPKHGRMALDLARVCAYAQLRDQAQVAATMKDISDNNIDSWWMTYNADVCTGDLDDAAALLRTHLEDESNRPVVLAYLQDYRKNPAETAVQAEMAERRFQLRARKDIRALIEEYGHLDTYPIVARAD